MKRPTVPLMADLTRALVRASEPQKERPKPRLKFIGGYAPGRDTRRNKKRVAITLATSSLG